MDQRWTKDHVELFCNNLKDNLLWAVGQDTPVYATLLEGVMEASTYTQTITSLLMGDWNYGAQVTITVSRPKEKAHNDR